MEESILKNIWLITKDTPESILADFFEEIKNSEFFKKKLIAMIPSLSKVVSVTDWKIEKIKDYEGLIINDSNFKSIFEIKWKQQVNETEENDSLSGLLSETKNGISHPIVLKLNYSSEYPYDINLSEITSETFEKIEKSKNLEESDVFSQIPDNNGKEDNLVIKFEKNEPIRWKSNERIKKNVNAHRYYAQMGGYLYYITSYSVFLHERDESNKEERTLGGIYFIFREELEEEEIQSIILINTILAQKVLNAYYLEQLRYTQTVSAINSILIDSYAHNISAHSLNFLQSLFNYRNEQYLKQHYYIPQFGRLENLPLNTISYSNLFSANNKNKDEHNDTLIHYKARGISDSSSTIFDTTLLDYILYSNNFTNKKGKAIPASNLLQYEDKNGKLPMPLDYAIAPLLTYLRDKGAFWSGVIRDNQATPSRIVSMYDLLMEMFNNPLFIGSIMAAEEFFVVHVFVDTEGGPKTEGQETVEETADKRHFLTINIKEFVEGEMNLTRHYNGYEKYKTYLNKYSSDLHFVRLTESHENLRKILQNQTILLPGGDVGKHAFFTIIENTLRNAKHITKEHRDSIKQNGLELHFQIREYNFMLRKKILNFISEDKLKNDVRKKLDDEEKDKNNKTREDKLKEIISKGEIENLANFLKSEFKINDSNQKISKALIENKELYLIGVNINYRGGKESPIYNFNKPKDNSEDLRDQQFKMIKSVIRNSYQSILTDNGHPRMGGSNQDKVCAAALFNKSFTSAEYPHKEVESYYPWIAYNLYPDTPNLIKKNWLYNKELRKKTSKEERKRHLDNLIKDENYELDANLSTLLGVNTNFNKKLYIKFFHIWKAKDVQIFEEPIRDDTSAGKFIDTIPRYKIAVVNEDSDSKSSLKKRAVIRSIEKNNIIEEVLRGEEREIFEKLYEEWNKKWKTNETIYFEKNGTIYELSNDMSFKAVKGIHTPIKIDHDTGSEKADVCKLRTHGYMLKYFFNCSFEKLFTPNNEITNIQYHELLETINTKIFIADNRLFSLVDNYTLDENKKEKKKDKILKTGLNLNIISENKNKKEITEEIKNWSENRVHFFILHLSYAEYLSKDKKEGNRYENLIDQIFGLQEGEDLSDNTIIAMTTGRGRADWLDQTGRHRTHCIHIPIESLQTAIQQGVLFKDDFDIKYNLCKVLFGS